MLNEGILSNSSKTLIKTEMIKQLDRQRETTPDQWERAVFSALTDQRREDVDWEIEDNQAGYFTWIKAFDQLIGELVEDGYVKVRKNEDGSNTLLATTVDPPIEYSHMVHPPKP